jgi:cytochrome c oxidase subunit 2
VEHEGRQRDDATRLVPAVDGRVGDALHRGRYKFDPARIEVKQGDVVELVLRSADTDHGLAIKAYAVKVAIPKSGAAVEVSFVASRLGSFPIECSEYCGSGHKRMRGELVVTEKAQ